MPIDSLGRFVRVPIKDRFWSKVNKNGPMHPYDASLGPCWIWTGEVGKRHGYGEMRNTHGEKKRHLRAHRVAWMLSFGKIPRGKCVLHGCDNRRCVNVAHLELGTYLKNNRDMFARGRGMVSEKHYRAKITNEQALYILSVYPRATRTGKRSPEDKKIITELCQKFGVSFHYLTRLASGDRWRHIKR
jgi:hypothetical protein